MSGASAKPRAREPASAGVVPLKTYPKFDMILQGPQKFHRRREDNHLRKIFHQFQLLPVELQRMVWGYTWPPSRVIELAICEDESNQEEYFDVAILRPTSSLSSLLEDDFGSRAVEQRPLEKCLPPVALQVCQESRRHTLMQYKAIEHSGSSLGSFYFNPNRDILWLGMEFTDEPEYLQDLKECYGEQLEVFETLLVEEVEWEDVTPDEYTSYFLAPFTGLKAILLLFMDIDTDEENSTDEAEAGVLENEANSNDEESDEYTIGDYDENNDQGSEVETGEVETGEFETEEAETGELNLRADKFRVEYAKVVQRCQGSVKSFWCIDRTEVRRSSEPRVSQFESSTVIQEVLGEQENIHHNGHHLASAGLYRESVTAMCVRNPNLRLGHMIYKNSPREYRRAAVLDLRGFYPFQVVRLDFTNSQDFAAYLKAATIPSSRRVLLLEGVLWTNASFELLMNSATGLNALSANIEAMMQNERYSRMAHEESKRSLQKARKASILTFLATIFVPLAATAAIFSMSPEWAPGGEKFGYYWAITLPLVFLLGSTYSILGHLLKRSRRGEDDDLEN